MKNIDFYSLSFLGKRQNNEDSYLSVKLDKNNILLAVADGMGGAVAGEIASKIAITTLQDFIRSHLKTLNDNTNFKEILNEVFNKIQVAIKQKIVENPELKGMGTTLSVLWIYKQQYIWGNLGDSRIYFLNNKIIKQITRDHTFIQDYIDTNKKPVPPEIANQFGNYITRSLDGGNDKPDIFPLNKPVEVLTDNCAFIICSDGLLPNKLDNLNHQYHSIFLQSKTLEQASSSLIKFAFDNGSTDNITTVLAEFGEIKRKIKLSRKIKTVVAVVGMVALIAAGILFYLNKNKIFNNNNIVSQTDTITELNNQPNSIKENQEETNYPKYKPFSKEQYSDKFNLNYGVELGFFPYKFDKNPIKISKYKVSFIPGKIKKTNEKKTFLPGEGKIKEFSINKNSSSVRFRKKDGLKKGIYQVRIDAITEDGTIIKGTNPQVITVK